MLKLLIKRRMAIRKNNLARNERFMLFIIICWLGLIFLALTLPGALKRRNRSLRAGPHLSDAGTPDLIKSQSADYSPLARDRLEVLELWEKCHENPDLPPPIPPSKPHSYFGDEKGKDIVD